MNNSKDALTDNVEAVVQRHLGLGADLALVNARVPLLRRLYLQRPVSGLIGMDHLKSHVGGIHECASAQYVHVPLTHPGYLRTYRQQSERFSQRLYV